VYVPAVIGSVNDTAAVDSPVAGAVLVPFRYFQSSRVSSDAYSANQSLAPPGPLATVPVIVAPGAGVFGLIVNVGPDGSTVSVWLVANSAAVSFA
jgi:hypothetical protein